ncbi:response regulator [Microvirga puerhi]|uniref:Response regulator n=1 Tax=Microvirga puerhi TaxID=2876078 RepID=A0ABS7VGS2_9HYPH|nr:response regulator [Microvirga puerhi]MBZ6074706.1 response regulator [Microvirga puerhi]
MATQPLCMIVEDQALIGFNLETFLSGAGFGIVSAFPDNMSALAWLNRNQPDVALLDFMLRDGSCVPIARALRARGIPFAVYSAMPHGRRLPREVQTVPWLEKPSREEQIVETLADLAAHSHASDPH